MEAIAKEGKRENTACMITFTSLDLQRAGADIQQKLQTQTDSHTQQSTEEIVVCST